MDNPIIVVTGNEPIPTFFKDEAWASRSIIVGTGTISRRMLGARLSELVLAETITQELDVSWLGPDPCVDADYSLPESDCKLDHGERTNYKLKDQPFYMRGAKGKMRRY